MLIQCGPRFMRIFKVAVSDSHGPRAGGKWWDKVGTMVAWNINAHGIGRSLCDTRTDADRVGMRGCARWMESRGNQHYQQWYDQLPQHQICAILPVYLYENSNIKRVSIEPFQAPAHITGQCGWIYCSVKSVRQRWPNLRHRVHDLKHQAYDALAAEIQELDSWLRDGAYMWTVEHVENRPGVQSGEIVALGRDFFGFNPYANGMMASIPSQYKNLLEEWCNERRLSRP